MERKVLYFGKPGTENTEACLEVVKNAIKNEKYKHLVLATTYGDTAVLFAKELKNSGVNIVAVTHSAGFKSVNTSELSPENRKTIETSGTKVFTGTMITHNIETAFASKFSGLYPTLLVANTLRRFGEGAKVCCEIVMMAVDAGFIPENEDVLAVAGTSRGADTVLVIKSAASKRFFELKVLEILAKPRG